MTTSFYADSNLQHQKLTSELGSTKIFVLALIHPSTADKQCILRGNRPSA